MLRSLVLNSLLAATALGASVPKSKALDPNSQWQIILSGTLDNAAADPQSAKVWDLDLFNTAPETIASLKAAGKTVICYFSAGTSEPSRPDLGGLGAGDSGSELKDWPGEYWLNLRSDNVFNIMSQRIALAKQKGCDGVDPDNMDGYQENGGGLSLTTSDSISFLQKMAAVAVQNELSIGLKNAIDIIDAISENIQFAVNEECQANSECGGYSNFLATGKPVFHIEYSAGASAACNDARLTTVVKNLSLDGWVQYCDGTTYTTPTSGQSRRSKNGH